MENAKETLLDNIEALLDLLTVDQLEYVFALVKRFARTPRKYREK